MQGSAWWPPGSSKERKMSSGDDHGATSSKRSVELRSDPSEAVRRNFRHQNRKASAPVLSSDYKSSRMFNQDADRPGEQPVDPIYLALKMANEMAQRRRSSVNRMPPHGLISKGTMPNSQDGSADSTLEELPTDMSHSRESVFSRKQSSCQISLTPSSVTSSSRSSPGPLLLSEVKSSPNLTSQKSMESTEGEVSIRQVRKLGMKMKSFSLDCDPSTEQSGMHGQGDKRSGFSVLKGGRCFKVRPLIREQSSDLNEEDSALESDVSTSSGALAGSSKSKSLGPILCVVTHEFRAKFTDELELKKAERVVVFDRSDPDWWQGYKQSESAGRFPSTCVARILPNERVMQVVQNLNLWDGSTNLRLYRDQVVFAQPEDQDDLAEIRTEKNRRINCPAAYLLQKD
uniref:SH3 domain-containing protein n=1 Tax=Trichuris muris TaxID=70415 RepID=A0A5S6R4I7_TRIMR